MTKPSIQSIVGKTIESVRSHSGSAPFIEIKFTDGTVFEMLDAAKSKLEWAFHYGEKDEETVSGILGK